VKKDNSKVIEVRRPSLERSGRRDSRERSRGGGGGDRAFDRAARGEACSAGRSSAERVTSILRCTSRNLSAALHASAAACSWGNCCPVAPVNLLQLTTELVQEQNQQWLHSSDQKLKHRKRVYHQGQSGRMLLTSRRSRHLSKGVHAAHGMTVKTRDACQVAPAHEQLGLLLFKHHRLGLVVDASNLIVYQAALPWHDMSRRCLSHQQLPSHCKHTSCSNGIAGQIPFWLQCCRASSHGLLTVRL